MSTDQPANNHKQGLPAIFDSIAQSKASEAVMEALRMVSENTSLNCMAILSLDQRFFCKEAPSALSEKLEAVATLL